MRSTTRGAAAAIATAVLLSGCGGAALVESRTSARRPGTTTEDGRTFTPDELLDRAKGSLVRIRNTGCGELSTGSGFLGPRGMVLTNRHVVEGHHTLELLTWDGIDLEPDAVEVSDGLDVARLHGDWSSTPLSPVSVRSAPVEPGERIAIVGFPGGDQIAITTGVATGYEPDPERPQDKVLKITTLVKPGNSGGPALDVRGEVVGIVFAEEIATDEALVVPIDTALSLPNGEFRPEPACR